MFGECVAGWSNACFGTISKDENEPSGVWVIPTSDPAANLYPAKPQDFSAFINLVEFCRYFLKNSDYLREKIVNHWL